MPGLYSDDYAVYYSNAKSLVDGAQYAMPNYVINNHYAMGTDTGQGAYPPGLPLLWAGAMRLGYGDLGSLAAMNVIITGLLAASVIAYLWRPAGAVAALAVGLHVGFSPSFDMQGNFRAPSEPLFLLLLVVTLFTDRWRQADRPYAAFGQAVAMLSMILARIPGIIIIPALGVAELLRRRRLDRRVVAITLFTGALAGLILLLLVGDYFSKNAEIMAASASAAGPGAMPNGLSTRLICLFHVALHNLTDLPGNLSSLWSWGMQQPSTPIPFLPAAQRRLLGLITEALALVGFIRACLSGVTIAETFFVLQLAVLLTLEGEQSGPRYYMANSLLMLFYAAMSVRWLSTKFPQPVTRAALLALLVLPPAYYAFAVTSGVRQAGIDDFPITDAPSRQALAWLRANVGQNERLAAHRPRTFALFTGSAAADYHIKTLDDAFFSWASEAGIGYLVLYAVQPEVRDRVPLARKNDPDALSAALNSYTEAVRAPSLDRSEIVFDNQRFVVIKLKGGAAQPPGIQ